MHSHIQRTDICEYALRALKESHIKRVYLIGRQGPLQVSFSTKELRSMSELPGCRFRADPGHFEAIRHILSGTYIYSSPWPLSNIPTPIVIIHHLCRFTSTKAKTSRTLDEGYHVSYTVAELYIAKCVYLKSDPTVQVSAVPYRVPLLFRSGDKESHKEWCLHFQRTPVEILPDTTTGRVASVRLQVNQLEVIKADGIVCVYILYLACTI